MEVSRIIREARTEKGWTQSKLANELGVTRNAVSNWENGTSVPKRTIAIKLTQLLDISLGRLVPVFTSNLDVVDSKAEVFTIDKIDQKDLYKSFSSKNNSIDIMKLYINENEGIDAESLGVVLNDTSMQPLFNSGDTLIFDKTTSPDDGDIVLCYHKDTQTYFIRNYVSRGVSSDGVFYFDITANDPSSTTYTCSKHTCQIIGVLVESRKKYRRKN